MNIIFSHCTQSYPLKFTASNTKVEFMAKGMQKYGAHVCIIGDIFGEKKKTKIMSSYNDKIKYYLFPRKYHILISAFINLLGWIKVLRDEKNKNEKNILFVGGIFPIFWLHIIIGKLLGYKCVLLTQEWAPSLNIKSFIERINAKISVHFNNYFLDAILPISHFLWRKNERFKKPMLIVPVLADYNTETKKEYTTHNYFAYCADASYFRVLKMILNAYSKYLSNGGKARFILILSGREQSKQEVISYIKSLSFNKSIDIKSQISSNELKDIYNRALGLIIPLDPKSIQDEARFSQKIAEYVSSSRPIITSAVGEIPYYFKNDINACIVDYTLDGYANAMTLLSNNQDYAMKIGIEGYNVGKKYFDCYKNGHKLIKFFESL